MLSYKFKIIFIIIFFMSLKSYSFSDMECFEKKFEVRVSHKDMPFGLTDTIVDISKNGCEILIKHERLKFLKTAWLIDICRGPVHIKKGSGTVDVIKKKDSCKNMVGEKFCKETLSILTKIQDDGLIFAKGEKEDLSFDHGKVFCSFQLVNTYLNGDIIFNRGQRYEKIFEIQKNKMASKMTGSNPRKIQRKEYNEKINEKSYEELNDNSEENYEDNSDSNTYQERGTF